MAKLPTIKSRGGAGVQAPPLPAPDALTPAQRQVYNDRKAPPAGVATGQQMKLPNAGGPSFVGGGAIPLLTKRFEAISSDLADGGTGETAIATDLSYVMEGVDTAIAVYSAANGSKLFGPYSPDSFFAPVKHTGDTFYYPQMYYDTMRDRWIVVYLEIDPSHTVTYLDVAVSQSTSPSQPTPGAQYNVYQFATDFEPLGGVNSYCDYETLGVEYWGVYITCVNYRNFSFVGNTVLAINKTPLLNGTPAVASWFWNDALKITSDAGPALELSPALEEGVQDAEYVIATDAGYGTTSQNLTVCALTNQNNMNSVMPTLSCLHGAVGIFYSDPLPARQRNGPTFGVGYGTKQVYYKAGRLFLTWTSAISSSFDGIVWAEVRPILAPINLTNPRLMTSIDMTQAGRFFYGSDTDAYTPSIVGTDEDDIVLVFNASGTSLDPGIYFTGRKANDQVGLMGQYGVNQFVFLGAHPTTAFWGKYSACAISLNSVTRGGIWCASEQAGPTPDPGWDTALYNLRAE
jgi:hypothetical protein